MARAKKGGDKAPNSIEITFRGGPKDGTTLLVVNPPPPRLRMAFPEWCNYYRDGNTTFYDYDMDREWVTVSALSKA